MMKILFFSSLQVVNIFSLHQTNELDCNGGYYRETTLPIEPFCVPCPAGTYSSTSRGSQNLMRPCAHICPQGHYCPEGSTEPIPCPAGKYGKDLSLTTNNCNGDCFPGYFCLEGSSVPDQHQCGNETYVCAAGSIGRTRVQVGFYSSPLTSRPHAREAQLPCEPGHFCYGGLRRPCPAGTFGSETNIHSSLCTAACPLGHYCPLGSSRPTPCPAGSYGDSPGLSNSSCSGQCQPGYWCSLGSTSPRENPCPAGRYGAEAGLISDSCSLLCEVNISSRESFCMSHSCDAGYFCPEASVSPRQKKCGGSSFYCPTGSFSPTLVSDGFYTIGPFSVPLNMQSDDDKDIRTDQRKCEPGSYCSHGIKTLCPPGFYGSDYGLTKPYCSGPCSEGFYCVSGSSSPMQFTCGGPSFYCSIGSSLPIKVPPGFYSIGGGGSALTRTAISPCSPGHYCIDGIRRPCPDGYYSILGSTNEFCDAECPIEDECAAGTVEPHSMTPTMA